MGTVRYTVLDGEIVSENRGGVERDYVPDPLGSTVALLDNTQTQTDTLSYWPYGEEKSRAGSTPTPFCYVGTWGYHRDSAKRAYVRSRQLDLTSGRWLTRDPLTLQSAPQNPLRSFPVVASPGRPVTRAAAPATPGPPRVPLMVLRSPTLPPEVWSALHLVRRGPTGWYEYANGSPATRIDPLGLQSLVPPIGLHYGKYCGFFKRGPGPAIDCIDEACRRHDNCMTLRAWCDRDRRLSCDFKLCDDAKA